VVADLWNGESWEWRTSSRFEAERVGTPHPLLKTAIPIIKVLKNALWMALRKTTSGQNALDCRILRV